MKLGQLQFHKYLTFGTCPAVHPIHYFNPFSKELTLYQFLFFFFRCFQLFIAAWRCGFSSLVREIQQSTDSQIRRSLYTHVTFHSLAAVGKIPVSTLVKKNNNNLSEFAIKNLKRAFQFIQIKEIVF